MADDYPDPSTTECRPLSDFFPLDSFFTTVINATGPRDWADDNLGWDDNMGSACDTSFQNNYGADTVIVVPPGDYLFTDGATANAPGQSGPNRAGVVGATGVNQSDYNPESTSATFHASNEGVEFRFVSQQGGQDCLLANFEIWLGTNGLQDGEILHEVDDGGLMQDVVWDGLAPTDSGSLGQMVRVGAQSTNGGTDDSIYSMRGVDVCRGGSVVEPHPTGKTGVRIYPDAIGEIVVEDCIFQNMFGNAFRSSHGPVVCTLRNCTFINNFQSNGRFSAGGHPTKTGSYVNCSVLIDHTLEPVATLLANADPADVSDVSGMKCEATVDQDGAIIEDCELVCENVHPDSSADAIHRGDTIGDSNTGGYPIRNTRFEVRDGMGVIKIDNADGTPPRTDVGMYNVEIVKEDDTIGTFPNALIAVGTGRDGCEVIDSCLYAPAGDLDGVDSDSNITVENTNINVTGVTTTGGGTFTESGITTDGTCPAPTPPEGVSARFPVGLVGSFAAEQGSGNVDHSA